MEAIVEEFVLKQEQEYGTQGAAEGDSCSADEQEEEEEEDDDGEHEEEKDHEGICVQNTICIVLRRNILQS